MARGRRALFRALAAARMQRVARRASRGQVAVLMYHGFRDGAVAPVHNYAGMHVDVRQFREQARYLRERYNVVPLERVVDWLNGAGTLPEHPVALTMDDGYESVHRLAFPVLQEYELPASVFVATGFLNGTHPLWTDRVRLTLGRIARQQADVTVEVNGSAMRLDLSRGAALVRSARHLLAHLKPLDASVVRETVLRLEQHPAAVDGAGDAPPEVYAPLTWAQAREMADSGLVTIGSHTVTHSLLGRASHEEAAWDLVTSRRDIESAVGRECRTFCYPNGAPGDFNATTARLARDAGYICALTTVPGLNSAGADPFALRRVSVSDEDSFAEFEATVSGLRTALGSLRARVWEVASASPSPRLLRQAQDRLSP